MPQKNDMIDAQLGHRIRLEREARGWSLTELAERSGVSRAMINKVERGDSSPTATLLGRLSGAFGLTMSALLARAEAAQAERLVRAGDQPLWTDPATGYVRRQIAPAVGSALPLDLTQVELPPGASIAYPAAAFTFIRQVVYVLQGELTFLEGDTAYDMRPGDSYELGPPADCTFRNDSSQPCSYLVAVIRQ